jgi:FkbM family methyltransferase
MSLKDKLRLIVNRRYRISFSKSGEDIQLYKLLGKSQGMYLDIGCFEPITYSNTYHFYLRGWSGIVVDPNPELAERFRKIRPNDTFVNVGISQNPGKLKYYMLPRKMSSMNTFDYGFLEEKKLTNYIEKEIEVPLLRVEDLVQEYKLQGKIDFMDVDVEGLDYQVLMSNDWDSFRPNIVMVETDQTIEEDMEGEVYQLMKSQKYNLLGKMVQTSDGSGNLIFSR